MDGFLRAGSNDEYAIGYYTQADIPFYSALAQNYLTCDRYFASILGPTFPNRLPLTARDASPLIGNSQRHSTSPRRMLRFRQCRCRGQY